MRWQTIPIFIAAALLAGCSSVPKPKPIPVGSLEKFQARAAKFNEVVTVPTFETTTNDVAATADKVIADGNAALDAIGALKADEVNFRNTIVALDDMSYEIQSAENRLDLIDQTSTNSDVRDAASDAIKKIDEWSVGTDYREDVYAAVKSFAATQPPLVDEDKKLFAETLRDYRRAGLDLPKDQRDEVEKLRKELTEMETDSRTTSPRRMRI
jgi:Zn-dependent oligopeptidase